MNFAKRLKKLRKEAELTQKELANKIGVSRATVAGYETKGKEPSYETLSKISKVLNCSIDYLMGNTDERSSADKIKKAISDDPELQETWEQISQRENLQLLFKQTKDLDDKAIKQIIRIIKAIEDEEQANQ